MVVFVFFAFKKKKMDELPVIQLIEALICFVLFQLQFGLKAAVGFQRLFKNVISKVRK